MYFRLRVRYQINSRLFFSAAEALHKGFFLHRMLDVELRRAQKTVCGDKSAVQSIGIVPPGDKRPCYEAGEWLEFDINVFASTAYAPEIITMALFNMEHMGKQSSHPRLKLIRLSSVIPGQIPVVQYDENSYFNFLEADFPMVNADLLCFAAAAAGSTPLLLDTITPVIITSSTKRQLQLDSHPPKIGRLVRAILRRCTDYWPEALAAITRHTSRDALEAHADNLDRSVGAVLHAPSFAEPRNYRSSNHATPMKIDGYHGQVLLNGDWQPLLPILRVGSWIQIGQKTALGFGAYQLATATPDIAKDWPTTFATAPLSTRSNPCLI